MTDMPYYFCIIIDYYHIILGIILDFTGIRIQCVFHFKEFFVLSAALLLSREQAALRNQKVTDVNIRHTRERRQREVPFAVTKLSIQRGIQYQIV